MGMTNDGLAAAGILEDLCGLQGDVEEQALGVSVSLDMVKGSVEKIAEERNVGGFDVCGEIFYECQFFPICHHQFLMTKTHDNTQLDCFQCIEEIALLVLSAYPGDVGRKSDQFRNFCRIAVSHPVSESGEVKLILFNVFHPVHGKFEVA